MLRTIPIGMSPFPIANTTLLVGIPTKPYLKAVPFGICTRAKARSSHGPCLFAHQTIKLINTYSQVGAPAATDRLTDTTSSVEPTDGFITAAY